MTLKELIDLLISKRNGNSILALRRIAVELDGETYTVEDITEDVQRLVIHLQ